MLAFITVPAERLVLGLFLRQRGDLPLLAFIIAVQAYESSYGTAQDIERIARGSHLFDRFLSRNASELVTLPDMMREAIVRDVFTAEVTIASSLS